MTELFIRPGMIVPGDATATVKKIAASEALIGYLVFKSGFLPRILGILLMLAGLYYTVLAVLFFLFQNLDLMIFCVIAIIGEMIFYLWLLIKGVNVKEWNKRALESAG